MKITTMLAAAGLAAASLGISTNASAQSWGGNRDGYRDNHRDRGDYRGHDGYRDRDRGYRNGRHYDRGRHYGWDRGRRWNSRYDRHCRTIWRYGHRVRICR